MRKSMSKKLVALTMGISMLCGGVVASAAPIEATNKTLIGIGTKLDNERPFINTVPTSIIPPTTNTEPPTANASISLDATL